MSSVLLRAGAEVRAVDDEQSSDEPVDDAPADYEPTVFTGVDSIFITAGPAGPGIRRFLDELSEQWPNMLVGFSDDEGAPLEGDDADLHEWRASRDLLPDERGSVYVLRDDEMDAFTDDHAYALDEHGEGPLYFIYSPLSPDARVSVTVEEPYSWDCASDSCEGHEDERTFTAVGAPVGMSSVTVVTADDEDPFDKSVLTRFVAALRASAKG